MNSQRGAVSIFIVIFSALLISVATLSFVRVMLNDQRQAVNNDLSQSAYDSAQAGVEDAKRALLRYQTFCATNPGSCSAARGVVASPSCNVGVGFSGSISAPSGAQPEVLVQQNAGDAQLQQAYTCVTMQLITNDYVGSLGPNESTIVPLIGDGTFNQVTLRWYSADKDVSSPSGAINDAPVTTGDLKLPQGAAWTPNTPPVFRAQLMQFGSSFTLAGFDSVSGNSSNANTLFLYPKKNAPAATLNFKENDFRKDSPSGDPIPANPPINTRCVDVPSGGYACTAVINLPSPIGSGQRTAFLRLTPYYTGTSFQVTLSNTTGGIVQFKDVQPIVDSTGRANDLFRRIQARVNLYDTSAPLPDGAVDLTAGGFCKDFTVTDTDYESGNLNCRP